MKIVLVGEFGYDRGYDAEELISIPDEWDLDEKYIEFVEFLRSKGQTKVESPVEEFIEYLKQQGAVILEYKEFGL